MKIYSQVMGYIVAFIVSMFMLGFISNSLGLVSVAFFAPKVEQVRYNTFKQSQSYNEGMVRDLENIRMQYETSNPEQKVMMRAIALRRFSVYDVSKLPLDLQQFYYSIQGETK